MLPFAVQRAADAAAQAAGIPTSHLLAVIDVESDGEVFTSIGGKQMPLILFEPAVFYRYLSGAARDKAVAQKLASPVWNPRLYAKTQAGRYGQLMLAAAIDHDAAYESTSWGVGQVLAGSWKQLGYASLQDFIDKVEAGVDGQIEAMIRFIKVNHLDDELRDGRWAAFARGYNGPGYKKNFYDTKLAHAADLYGGATVAAPDGMLRMGAKGQKVREVQALLLRAGVPCKQDGDFGPVMKTAVMAFQTAHGIDADGVVGPETERQLETYRTGPDDAAGVVKFADIDGVKQGSAGVIGGVTLESAKEAVNSATDSLQQVAGVPIVDYILTALSVAAAVLVIAGLAWAAWSWLNSKKTVQS